jgi:hypothetical protein
MSEDPEHRNQCPVLLFLPLAYADEVFMPNDIVDISAGPHRLHSLELPRGEEVQQFRYRPGVRFFEYKIS